MNLKSQVPVVGYLRVSTPGQARDGASIETQRARVEAWAAATAPGQPLLIFADEGVSGTKTRNRPGFLAARDAVLKSGGVLVAYSLSRLARSTRDAIALAEDLKRAGASLVSLSESIDTGSAMGACFFTILAAIAQLEADIASERTRHTFAHLRLRGRRLGRLAFGYDVAADGKKLVENSAEQEVIALMQRLRADGSSLREIGDELKRRGVRTKRGCSTWTASAINQVLRRSARAA
jgi:DNA invertase Pin-like site-specific DNA recombinase